MRTTTRIRETPDSQNDRLWNGGRSECHPPQDRFGLNSGRRSVVN
jgi:hypothetical protein